MSAKTSQQSARNQHQHNPGDVGNAEQYCLDQSTKHGNYFSRKADKYAENLISFGREVSGMCRDIDYRSKLRRSFTLNNLRNKLPIAKWLPNYRLHHLQGDVIAGVTVGLLVIPQAIAYAKIAELPPQYGLYTAIASCFMYTLLGTAPGLSNGPCAVMALLTYQFARPGLTGDARSTILLTFVTGVVQLLMGFFNIGFVIDYVSHVVLNGFISAAAITIACSQLKKWLGLRRIPRDFVGQLITLFKKLKLTNFFDLGLGLICMIILYLLKKLKETTFATTPGHTRGARFVKQCLWFAGTARNAAVVMISTLVVVLLNRHDIRPFSLTGPVASGIPSFTVPEFSWTRNNVSICGATKDNVTYSFMDNLREFDAGVLLVPVVSAVESIAVGKALGHRYNYQVDANQEILAVGVGNLLGSFLSAFPSAGSLGRSAVNAQSGVQTTAGNIFTGVLVLLALQFLSPVFYFIPEAALAAVIIMAASSLVDFSIIPHLWAVSKFELIPWFATFTVSLLSGVENGLLLGVSISLLSLLYPWSKPKTEVKEINTAHGQIAVVTINVGLVFPGVERLEENIYGIASPDCEPKSIVLNLVHVSQVDYTAIHGLQVIQQKLAMKHVHLVLCNLQPQVKNSLIRTKPAILSANSVDDAIVLIQERQINLELAASLKEASFIDPEETEDTETHVTMEVCSQKAATNVA